MDGLEAGICRSISHYQAILGALSELERLLQSDQTEAICSFVERLGSMQAAASQLDEELLAGLTGSGTEVIGSDLCQERLRLIAKVLDYNRLLSEKIGGNMAIISAELAQIREGKKVVSGYKPGKDTRGTRVRNAC